jgi:carbonic anhydrase
MRFFIGLLLFTYCALYPLTILRSKFDKGGKDWNGICKIGRKQSPINLEKNVLKLPKNILVTKIATLKGKMKWNGAFYRLDDSSGTNKLTFTEFFTGKSQEYVVKRVVIRTPGEHHIKSEKFDAEVQVITLAKNCQVKNELTILSFLAKTVDDVKKQNGFFNSIKLDKPSSVNVGSLIGEQKAYFFYEGSQTVPDCNENVNWIVYEKPILVSKAFLISLQKNCCPTNFPFGNARPLQNLNGRTILRYSSDGR